MLKTNEEWNGRHNLNSVFERHGVSKTSGYTMLRENLYSDRTFPHRNELETRGAPKKISQEKI